MRVPLSWMRDFAPFGDDWQAVAAAFDELGLVVEQVEHVGSGLSSVVVARVESIGAIDGADRIRRVVVDAGAGPVEVVCGAWNFSAGDLVAFAPVGSVLAGGLRIERRKLRGVVSNGMLCSAREMGIGEDHEGIVVLEAPRAPGTPILDALGVAPDVVFEVAAETNRPDAFSIAGVSRDVAAWLGLPFTSPDPVPVLSGTEPTSALVEVVVEDPELCPRFTAHVLSEVAVGPSPPWVQRRLTLAGMRPINNVVDASNYVMLELGQPTHPYDLDQVAGPGLRIRASHPGETLTTLDGSTRVLGTRTVAPGDDRRDCVICDATGTAIGVAGVMGGASSEITAGTTRVLLEAAYFEPMAIARTSARLALRTEASARFERGCDPEGIDRAVARLVEILAISVPGLRQAPAPIDRRGPVPAAPVVAVRVGRVNAVLGTDLDAAQVAGYLEPIGFSCKTTVDGDLHVQVPSFRPDTTREVDVVEEVARHYGYRRIPRRRLRPPQVGALDRHQRQRRLVREVLVGLGADEAWTASLLAPGTHERVGLAGAELTVANPMAADEAVLRRTLLPGLLGALAFNAARRSGRLRLFEIGHVFPPPPPDRVRVALTHEDPDVSVVDERELLGAVFAGEGDDGASAVSAWATLADALGLDDVDIDQQAIVGGLHPTRRGALLARCRGEWAVVGEAGEVDPDVAEGFAVSAVAAGSEERRVGWLQLDLGLLLDAADCRSPLVAPVSRYPTSDVDLSLVVADTVPAGAVHRVLRDAGGEWTDAVWLFDTYRGAGIGPEERSLTFRLRFGAPDHTLTDDEVAGLRAACLAAAERRLGASART